MFPSSFNVVYLKCVAFRTSFNRLLRSCTSVVDPMFRTSRIVLPIHTRLPETFALDAHRKTKGIKPINWQGSIPGTAVLDNLLLYPLEYRDTKLIDHVQENGYSCRNKRTKLAIKKRRKRLGERISLRYR